MLKPDAFCEHAMGQSANWTGLLLGPRWESLESSFSPPAGFKKAVSRREGGGKGKERERRQGKERNREEGRRGRLTPMSSCNRAAGWLKQKTNSRRHAFSWKCLLRATIKYTCIAFTNAEQCPRFASNSFVCSNDMLRKCGWSAVATE